MKFSINFLLALLLVGALLTNYFVMSQSAALVAARESAQLAEIDKLCFKAAEAKSTTPLYLAALKGEKLLNAKYESSFAANQDLPNIVSELEIKDPNLISYCALPLLSEGAVKHFACRIHVPTGSPVFLSTVFEDGDLTFQDPKKHSLQLSPGLHIVDFRYDYTEKLTLELFIDQQQVFSVSMRQKMSGYSSSGTLTGSQIDLAVLEKPQKLFRITPSSTNDTQKSHIHVFLQGEASE